MTLFFLNIIARSVDERIHRVYMEVQRELERQNITNPSLFQTRASQDYILGVQKRVKEAEERKRAMKEAAENHHKNM